MQRFAKLSLIHILAMKDFKKDSLDAHNEFRGKHGAPSMKWSSKLASNAQKWAEDLAKKGYLQHANQKEEGENIACMKGEASQILLSLKSLRHGASYKSKLRRRCFRL